MHTHANTHAHKHIHVPTQIMAAESPWVDVSVWEVTRAVGYLDHPTILSQISSFLRQHVRPDVRASHTDPHRHHS